MKYTLYRNMSREEADNVLSTNIFTKPTNIIYLPRKWFSTSIFRSHYFKSPFYSGETAILKVDINEEYYRRIFSEGKFIPREPNGFYCYDEDPNPILYAKAHKTIPDLYNIGFLDLPSFNREILSISEIDGDAYCSYTEGSILGTQLSSLALTSIESEYDFYMQVSFDVAVLLLKYQTLMPESINPVIKCLHFSKDLEELKKKNLNKYTVTLRVRFKPNIRNYSIFNPYGFSFNQNEVIKMCRCVESIALAKLEPGKELKEYLNVRGNNEYTKHQRKSLPTISRLSFADFESVTRLLLKKDLTIKDLEPYLPFIKDVIDVNQVDPRHIDNLETHIIKSLNISNLVLNYFKDQGLTLDPEIIVYVKWLLLLHDLGKPYCECENITTRYSQFGDKLKYNEYIASSLLDEDILFPISEISKIFNMSSLVKHKKITRLLREIINDIIDFYKVDEPRAFAILSKYLQVALIAKVSHSASLKTRSYCSNYVDDIMFFDRINDVLISLKHNEFIYPYDEYYASVDDSYSRVVEAYYQEEQPKSILDIIRSIPSLDYKDLTISFNNKATSLPPELVLSSICPDEIISAYFVSDNNPLLSYLKEPITDYKAHGDSHSARVSAISYTLGRMYNLNEEDLLILLLSSHYHDIGRQESSQNHSLASVSILKREGTIEDKSIKDYVYFVIEAHDFPDSKAPNILAKYNIDKNRAMRLLNIFKDSDALDRVRFDKEDSQETSVNYHYLRTDLSPRLIKFASILSSATKSSPKELSPQIKALLKK